MIDLFKDIFGVNIFDEYYQYKGKTPYKLVKMKSGMYAISFNDSLGTSRYRNLEDAKQVFITLCKGYLGE